MVACGNRLCCQCFKRTCCLHPQDRSDWLALPCHFAHIPLLYPHSNHFHPEDRGSIFIRNIGKTNKFHTVHPNQKQFAMSPTKTNKVKKAHWAVRKERNELQTHDTSNKRCLIYIMYFFSVGLFLSSFFSAPLASSVMSLHFCSFHIIKKITRNKSRKQK